MVSISKLWKCMFSPMKFAKCLRGMCTLAYPLKKSTGYRYFNILITWATWMYYESKWPPLACTQSLNHCGHPSIKLCNTSTGKSAAAFWRDRFKLSILGCLLLQHPLPWTELELPAGFSPSTQGTDNPAVAGEEYSYFISTWDWPCVRPDLTP